jgi:hypothetical protein
MQRRIRDSGPTAIRGYDAPSMLIRHRRAPAPVACLALLLTLAACGGTSPVAPAGARPTSSARAAATASPTATPVGPLVPAIADYHVPAVPVPLRLMVPSLKIDIPVVAVGIARSGAMDAPEGKPGDANWEDAFWYRGGVEPGRPGVATVAGHLDNTLGQPAAFWNIRQLAAGDLVEVLDQRTGITARFHVAARVVYDLAQVATHDVLTRMFGAGTVDGRTPQVPADGLPHLTLITCTGRFVNGEYDHRLVLYAVGDTT